MTIATTYLLAQSELARDRDRAGSAVGAPRAWARIMRQRDKHGKPSGNERGNGNGKNHSAGAPSIASPGTREGWPMTGYKRGRGSILGLPLQSAAGGGGVKWREPQLTERDGLRLREYPLSPSSVFPGRTNKTCCSCFGTLGLPLVGLVLPARHGSGISEAWPQVKGLQAWGCPAPQSSPVQSGLADFRFLVPRNIDDIRMHPRQLVS